MLIDCYLFSEIAQQVGHTYYSGLNHYHRIFYFNLCDFLQDRIPFKMFIYKVKVDSNDVYNLFQIGVRAVKYQVIEEVPFGDFVKEEILSKKTKNELISILNGTMSEDKVVKIYADSIEKGSFNLTKLQILKLHAVLAQTKYELPTLDGGPRTTRFLSLVEYYGKKYELNSNLKSYAKKSLEYVAMQGSKRFEYIKNEDVEELAKTSSDLMDLIRCRKLTQEQFEELCDLTIDPGISFGDFKAYAIISGYKIQPQHEKLFYPFIIYHNPVKIEDWIKNKIRIGDLEKQIALENNYMIDGVRYWNSYHRKVYETKKIFLKDGFKIIER